MCPEPGVSVSFLDLLTIRNLAQHKHFVNKFFWVLGQNKAYGYYIGVRANSVSWENTNYKIGIKLYE